MPCIVNGPVEMCSDNQRLVLPVLGFLLILLTNCGQEPKVWTEESPTGEVSEEYQFYLHLDNNRRMKHGWYNSYSENGDYREIGTYQHNERVGEWTFFTDDGRELEGIYREGVRWSGKFIKFYVDGRVNFEENYKDGELDGRRVGYYESGKVLSLLNYRDGELDERWVIYFDRSGKISSKGSFERGSGKIVFFYESGEVSSDVQFESGIPSGWWVNYDKDGTVNDEDFFKDGKCLEMCEGTEGENW